MLLSCYQQWPALAADPGINDHQMHSIRREIRVCLGNSERAVENVKGLNRIANVDNLRPWIDAQNHALHGTDKIVVETEVCGERDKTVRHLGLRVRLREINAIT